MRVFEGRIQVKRRKENLNLNYITQTCKDEELRELLRTRDGGEASLDSLSTSLMTEQRHDDDDDDALPN